MITVVLLLAFLPRLPVRPTREPITTREVTWQHGAHGWIDSRTLVYCPMRGRCRVFPKNMHGGPAVIESSVPNEIGGVE